MNSRRLQKEGISIKEAIREAVLEWVREKSGFDKEDPFFKMHTFRASKDLSENHDEIYEGYSELCPEVFRRKPVLKI